MQDLKAKRWLEGRSSITTPNYTTRVERPITPVRNYVR